MKHNPDAMSLLRRNGATPLPAQLAADVVAAPMPKRHVLVLPPDRIREVDGRTEVDIERRQVQDGQLVTTSGWGPPPKGAKVVPEGSTVGPEDMDIVYLVRSIFLRPGLVTPKGERPASIRPVAELARIDYREAMAAHGVRLEGAE